MSERPTRADVDRAIAVVENSRRTHVEWAEFIESGQTWTPSPDHVGDVEHHRECIVGYDHVLTVLRAAEPREDESSRSATPETVYVGPETSA